MTTIRARSLPTSDARSYFKYERIPHADRSIHQWQAHLAVACPELFSTAASVYPTIRLKGSAVHDQWSLNTITTSITSSGFRLKAQLIHPIVTQLNHMSCSQTSGQKLASTSKIPSPQQKLFFPDPLNLPAIEKAKRLAAHAAVNDHFPRPARVVGIGSGSTIVYAVEKILQLADLEDVVFVPTGFQSRELIVQGGLRLGAISESVSYLGILI